MIRKSMAAVAAAAAATLVVTACSSGSSPTAASSSAATASGSKAAQEANAMLAQYLGPVKWIAPGPAFDAKKAAGTKVLYIANDLSLPFSSAQAQVIKQELRAYGVDITVVDAGGDVDQAAKDIQMGIGMHVNVISMQTYPANEIAAPLAAAKAAGIKIVSSFDNGDPGWPTTAEKNLGIVANVDYSQSTVGKIMGAWAVAQSGGTTDAAAYGVLNDPGSVLQQHEEEATIKQLCSTCQFSSHRFQTYSDFYNNVPTQASSDLVNPDVNILMPDYDTFAQPTIPVIEQKNDNSKVSVIGFDGTPTVLQGLLDKGPMRGDVGAPYTWPAWGLCDEILRVLSGASPVESENIGLRLFDSSNSSSINFKGDDEAIYGIDLGTDYTKLWGSPAK